MKVKLFASIIIVATALGACSEVTEVKPPPAVETVTVDASGGSIFRSLSVTLADSARAEVTYFASGTPRLKITTATESREHDIFLPRLYENKQYTYEVRAVNEAGETGVENTGVFTTGALPPEIAGFDFTATGTATYPLIFIEVMISTTSFSGALIVDQKGEVVWFHRTSGFLLGTSIRTNGNFVLLSDSGLTEITPSRHVVRTLKNSPAAPYGTIHHDQIVTPQNTIYFLARENRVVDDTVVVGESIWEWVPETGATHKKWSAWDFFDWKTQRGPASARDNWMHSNSLSFGPRGNMVVSSRNMDQVFSIAADWKSLEWIIGGPGGNMAISDADKFYGQHSATEVATDRVLIFDNGFNRPPGVQTWSRVLELQLNRTAKTATKAWEFRPSPDNNALRVGTARRFTNGNSFALFGWGQGSPIVVYEINPAANPVYSLVSTAGSDRLYRATPMTTLGGEVEIN